MMMGLDLDDIRDHVASLFIMLNKKTAILFRIEFLVVLATLLFLAMFFMDLFRRTIHSPFMRAVFSVFDAVSDSIVVYLLGAIQTAPFKNQLFPVWALMLVNFRYSADYISGYGVPDPRGRRFAEWRNVVKLLGSAFLNRTRGSRFTGPLWLVWVLQVMRSAYRYGSHHMACRSFWHGRSSELVAEHMLAMHSSSMNKGGELMDPVPDPAATMKGYKYLVYGETKLQWQGGFNRLKKPQYVLCIDQQQDQDATANDNDGGGGATRIHRRRKEKTSSALVLTLDKIWDCPIPIHKQPQPHSLQQGQGRGEDDDGSGTKVLPLAFALSRLLRCRLEDVTLQPRIFDMNRELVKNMVGGKVATSDSDALRIMELQLSFVHDYFNTRYPMVFWCGLPSLFFSLLLSVLTICAVCWLAVDIRKVYKPPNGELAHVFKGFNVDIIITWVFIFLIVVKEIWEMRTYLLSDWTSLIMLCEYVQRKRKCKIRSKESKVDAWSDSILLYFSTRSRITDQRRWHGFIDQYVFVQSYHDTPWCWNLIHNLTTGLVPKKEDGAELSSPIQIPECVKQAVLEKLGSMIVEAADERPAGDRCTSTSSHRRLPRVIRTLSNSNLIIRQQLQNYQAYCSTAPTTTRSAHVALPTTSHIILVWHIATSLCEMELATKHGVNLSSPGFPWCLLSWFTSSCCCSSKPYLMDVGDKEDKDSILSWLAGFCSSNSKPSQKTTQGRNKEVNGGKLPEELRETYVTANSLSRYCAYLLIAKPDLIPDSFLVPKIVFQETVKSARDGILKGCGSCGSCGSLQERYRALKDEAEKPIKDSEKEDVLKQGVALGKELLDHLTEKSCWEILAGVWTELLIHIAPTRNARAHRKCLAGGEFITHIWALLWHCGIHSSSLWPKDDVGPAGNNDNKGTKEHEASNSKRGAMWRNDGSLEIEENSQDATLETTNVQTGPKRD
ncbi:uncharacterized protein [Miscanthus floridulus]|uniref:uncharacterized protein n=1 Tax=Miscanthus floridulus TaxID=154761 RepID=UPI00345B4481